MKGCTACRSKFDSVEVTVTQVEFKNIFNYSTDSTGTVHTPPAAMSAVVKLEYTYQVNDRAIVRVLTMMYNLLYMSAYKSITNM